MNIRPFAPGDGEAVIALWRECQLVRGSNEAAIRKQMRHKHDADPELFLVGEIEGQVVGTVIAEFRADQSGFLSNIAVAPPYRRRGYARALVAEAERLLRQRSCRNIRLTVHSTNLDAVACYRRLGYDVKETVHHMIKRFPNHSTPD